MTARVSLITCLVTAAFTWSAGAAILPLNETFDDDSGNVGTSNQPVEQGDTWSPLNSSSTASTAATWSLQDDTTTPGAVPGPLRPPNLIALPSGA